MIYVFDQYELDTEAYELRRGGEPCPLEPQEFEVLRYLIEHRDRAVTRTELLDTLWAGRVVTDGALSSRMKAIRHAVGDNGRIQRVIKTLHGRGYRFIAPVTVRTDRPGQSAPVSQSTAVGEPSGESACLFGREAELGRLKRWLDRTLAGDRQIVFVTGEAGLGKTTLANAFIEHAQSRAPILIAYGQCVDQHGAGEPYLPVLEALSRLGRTGQGQRLIEVLTRHAPTWLIQLPALIPDGQIDALRRHILGATRERMLRELTEALTVLSNAAPVLIVLEDLHWSDPSTVEWLGYIARRRDAVRLMVVATTRPTDSPDDGQGVSAMILELTSRGYAQALPLTLLSEPAVEAYLAHRLGGEAPAGLAYLVRLRTGGHPLFLHSLVEHWFIQNLVERHEGRWQPRTGIEALVLGVPDNLRELIRQQLAALAPEELRLLETASVAGSPFSAAVVAAGLGEDLEVVENGLARLARSRQFIMACAESEWADGTVAAGFAFSHDFYQEVIYKQVPAGRRARLHAAIGERLERAYGAQAAVHAAELALHFQRARDRDRTIRYLQLAAEQALARSAHREALALVTQALELLEQLPPGPTRKRTELKLQTLRAPALIALRGWAAQEVQQAYERAWTLCRELGDPPSWRSVIYGLATLYEYRGEYRESQLLLEQRLAREDAELLLESHELLACSLFHQGAFSESLKHADSVVAHYEPSAISAAMARYGENPGVSCHDWAALDLWFLGYPEQAISRAQQAMELAQDHAYSLTTALAQGAFLYQHLQDERLTQTRAEETIRVAGEQGFLFRIAQASILRGWALATQGDGQLGLAELQRGLDAYQASGAKMDLPYYLALLADALIRSNEEERAQSVLAQALDLLSSDRGFYYQAELHRLRGLLHQRIGTARAAQQAEACFRRALAVARSQGSKTLELRTAMSLGRLWRAQGRGSEARNLLAQVYGWFTEGFNTRDLRDAKALLDRLAAIGGEV